MAQQTIQCRVCGNHYRFITPSHLRKHGMTVAEYREQFPNAPLTSEADREVRAENARRQNAANFTIDGGREDVRAKMSAAARRRGQRQAAENTPAWQAFMAASKPFTVEQWQDPEWRSKMAEVSRRTLRKMWDDPQQAAELREKFRAVWDAERREVQSEVLQALWQDPEWRANLLAKWHGSEMNQFEQAVFEIIEPLGFEWVGDFSFWISRDGRSMNPDFVHREKRLIVEAFGDFWHAESDEPERKSHFATAGWQAVVVWQSEFKRDRETALRPVLAL